MGYSVNSLLGLFGVSLCLFAVGWLLMFVPKLGFEGQLIGLLLFSCGAFFLGITAMLVFPKRKDEPITEEVQVAEVEPIQERLERREFEPLRERINSKAIHQDLAKFMKHGKQSSFYRKTVKAKIQPEEEED